MKNKEPKTQGITIDFTGMTTKERLKFWWAITLACLFKKKTKSKVNKILI